MSPVSSSLSALVKRIRHGLAPTGEELSKIRVLDMLAHNWYLGFTSFGGPTVHFQIFRKLFVDKYKWLDETTYQEMFALCQALSGPGSTKMLYAINVMRYGFLTGLLAFFVWSLPTCIAAYGLSLGVAQIGRQLPGPVYALLSGLNSATVGIIALAAYQLSQKAITDTPSRILVFLGATAGMLYNALWYFPVIMVVGGVSAMICDLRLMQRGWRKIRSHKSNDSPEEAPRSENIEMSSVKSGDSGARTRSRTAAQPPPQAPMTDVDDEPQNHTLRSRSRLTESWKLGVGILAAFFAMFIVIMTLRGIYNGDNRGFDVFANLFLAGTIIFGGGPVVIPLLRAYVVAPGWVSPRDFLLGLAITQAFPGPNFGFAVYLGALAVNGTGIPSVGGALIGYLAIFSPGLWFHTGTMGIWSIVRKIHAVRACLRGIHAAAVGLVFTAVYRLFEVGYLDAKVQSGGSLSRDPWWVVTTATTFVGGLHFKLSPPMAIVLGAIMGLIQYGVAQS